MIVLIGPPGAGKTTVGALLAAALGLRFRDTDTEVEQNAGKPAGEVFLDDGEQRFRDLEREAALAALAADGAVDGAVVALGSGAILDQDVQRALAGATVVYLAADFGTVAKHAGLDRPRVPLPGNPRGRLRTMLAERAPLYERLATITIPADDAPAAELAAELARRLA